MELLPIHKHEFIGLWNQLYHMACKKLNLSGHVRILFFARMDIFNQQRYNGCNPIMIPA